MSREGHISDSCWVKGTVTDYKQLATTLAELQAEVVPGSLVFAQLLAVFFWGVWYDMQPC